MAEVIKGVLLDQHRLELYWNADVSGSDECSNVTVNRNGEQLHLHRWNESEEWDKGCVYEAEKKKTTLYIEECIYPYQLDALKIEFSDAVKDTNGIPVRKTQGIHREYTPFYEKYTETQCGIVIKTPEGVSKEAVKYAVYAVDHMLSKIPDVAETMRRFHAELAIYAKEQDAYAIPEHRIGSKILHRPVEGFGGVADLPVTSISERNILRITDGEYATRYVNEFILAHEFGHAVHLIGICYSRDQRRSRQLLDAYHHACVNGLWPGTYAIGNYEEYFATLTTIYFNVMAESRDGSWDGVRGPVNTREELRQYDPEAYRFFSDIYPEEGFKGIWSATPDYFRPDGGKR